MGRIGSGVWASDGSEKKFSAVFCATAAKTGGVMT